MPERARKKFLEDFQHVFDERLQEKELGHQIRQQEQGILLARRITTIRNQPGFQEFDASLRKLRDETLAELGSTMGTSEYLRVLQGKVQAYDRILSIVERADDEVQALEAGLKELQTKRSILRAPKKQEAT